MGEGTYACSLDYGAEHAGPLVVSAEAGHGELILEAVGSGWEYVGVCAGSAISAELWLVMR
jgi:hypothetical protein